MIFDEKEKEKDWYYYEEKLMNKGYKIICGVDEAGRGPLAGPVCAAAVILPPYFSYELYGINDSKKLTPKRREKLYDKIVKLALDYAVELVSEKVIDKINILNATMLCMKNAVEKLNSKPNLALIDGNRSPELNSIPTFSLVKGDSISASIAAASILAKVSRDRYMIKISEKYPQYNFDKNKGYGTMDHVTKIKKYGTCDIHRYSFVKKIGVRNFE